MQDTEVYWDGKVYLFENWKNDLEKNDVTKLENIFDDANFINYISNT